MGAGNKLDPTRFEVAELEKTSSLPAGARDAARAEKTRHHRREGSLLAGGADSAARRDRDGRGFRDAPPDAGQSALCPAAAGLILASAVVYDLIGMQGINAQALCGGRKNKLQKKGSMYRKVFSKVHAVFCMQKTFCVSQPKSWSCMRRS